MLKESDYMAAVEQMTHAAETLCEIVKFQSEFVARAARETDLSSGILDACKTAQGSAVLIREAQDDFNKALASVQAIMVSLDNGE